MTSRATRANGSQDLEAAIVQATDDLPPPTSEPLTPQKLSRFRIDGTNFVEMTREVLTTVLITAPPKDEFIRVHPDPDMRLVAYTISKRRDHYLVEPQALVEIRAKVSDFGQHASVVMLRPYVTREGGQLNLWPLKMESPHSIGANSWNISAHDIARKAETHWLRVTSNQARGQYVSFEPETAFPEPTWPELSIDELVDMASRVNLVDSLEHPLVRSLRGLPA